MKIKQRNYFLLGLAFVAFLVSSLTVAMDTQPQPDRYTQARIARDNYWTAIQTLDQQAVSSALDEVHKVRAQFGWWERWFSSDSAVRNLFNDAAYINEYYTIRRHKPEDFDDYMTLPGVVKRSLGYGRYVDARIALHEVHSAIRQNDPEKVKQAIAAVRAVRSQFSLLERCGVILSALDLSDSFDKARLFNTYNQETWNILQDLSRSAAAQNNTPENVSKCAQVIEALQDEYDIVSTAVSDSTASRSYQSVYVRNPIFLAALCAVKAPLNTQRLIEHEQSSNHTEASKNEIVTLLQKAAKNNSNLTRFKTFLRDNLDK